MRVLPPLMSLFTPLGRIPTPVSRSTRRAGRSVVWGVVLFVVIQLSLGYWAEVYPRLRDPLYGDKFVKLQKRLTKEPDAYKVVMLGSSRTGLAFHGKQAEVQLQEKLKHPAIAFNFGIPASGPVTHLVYLKRLIKTRAKPDHLFLEILPSMLADGHNGPIERHWFYADRLTNGERDIVIRNGFDAGKVSDRWWRSVLLPSYTLRFQLLTRVFPAWLPWQVRFDWSRGADECGWGKMENQLIPEANYQAGLNRARMEYAPILSNWTPGGGACDALRELLELCRTEGIGITLVLMPESEEFRSWYPQATTEKLQAYLRSLAVPVVDGRDWLKADAFTDGHHMLVVGAEAFTKRLIQESKLSPEK
jgi:hypothetical protein